MQFDGASAVPAVEDHQDCAGVDIGRMCYPSSPIRRSMLPYGRVRQRMGDLYRRSINMNLALTEAWRESD